MTSRVTSLDGVLLLEPKVFGDERGFFLESWNEKVFGELGLDVRFVQDNHSSSRRGILRGLHFQHPNPQGKLVWVVEGEIFDVVVDLRRSSPSFGKWEGVALSAENKRRIWIPPGFAHGFYVTSERAQFLYKCTTYYSPKDEHTLAWNDPVLGIQWPIPAGKPPILSAKDSQGVSLAGCPSCG
jgi:dTDP-4-dehydrorhamnose 3,5-epimerase